VKAASSSTMPEYPNMLPGFSYRQPDEESDAKILADIHEHGWHVVMIPDDDEGPGFAFTVGVYLRTLQPEILLMGVPMEPAHRILNAIAEYLMEGETITPGQRYGNFVDGLEVLFHPFTAHSFMSILAAPIGSTNR